MACYGRLVLLAAITVFSEVPDDFFDGFLRDAPQRGHPGFNMFDHLV
jgi:hypothetical protein